MKIDRIFGNKRWLDRWPLLRPRLLNKTSSDHSALLLELVELERGSKPFRYFSSWLQYEDFNECFRATRSKQFKGSPMYRLFMKLMAIKDAVRSWARETGNPKRESILVAAKLHAAVE